MENSKIEWTDHTFNPWHGCMKVSEGCKNCYAETLDNRWNGGHWGPNSPRKPMSEKYWLNPFKWDEDARKAGLKAKVFCASMADVFEDHPDVVQCRLRLFRLIQSTPNLIWQLLTKRPENILTLIPGSWLFKWPENVWIGTSVENQKAADDRIPHLLRVPSAIRFLSCEPMLGHVEFSDVSRRSDASQILGKPALSGIHWVIAGGESGPKARPMHPDWARSLRDQCQAGGVHFFFKQWGEWSPFYDRDIEDPDWRNVPRQSNSMTYINETGGTGFHGERVVFFKKEGKKASGSILDGREWKEFPA